MCGFRIRRAALPATLLCLISVLLSAQEPTVTPVMTKALPDILGKELLVITVDYAPGGADAVHRHNADALIYVLEGSIVEQVKGGKPVTLMPGQTFYEGPDDVHSVGRNASRSRPAKLLAILIKNKDAPPVVPVDK